MKVTVHLLDQAQPITRDDVVNAYVKGPFYCLYRSDGVVEKYPVDHVWRITEDYR